MEYLWIQPSNCSSLQRNFPYKTQYVRMKVLGAEGNTYTVHSYLYSVNLSVVPHPCSRVEPTLKRTKHIHLCTASGLCRTMWSEVMDFWPIRSGINDNTCNVKTIALFQLGRCEPIQKDQGRDKKSSIFTVLNRPATISIRHIGPGTWTSFNGLQ